MILGLRVLALIMEWCRAVSIFWSCCWNLIFRERDANLVEIRPRFFPGSIRDGGGQHNVRAFWIVRPILI